MIFFLNASHPLLFYEHKVPMPEAPELKLSWFLTLIRCTKNGSNDKSDQKSRNHTIILGNVFPMRLIAQMNRGEEDNIVTAASKALADPQMLMRSSPTAVELHPRFEAVCMMGPIPSREITTNIMIRWERQSRGKGSRTYIGCMIAIETKYQFSVNLNALLELNDTPFTCRILNTTPKNTTIEICTKQQVEEDRQKKIVLDLD